VRIEVVAAIIRKDDCILITQRPHNVHLPGLWEFPGGKVEIDESLEVALQREIQEEVGLKVDVLDEFLTVDHDYPAKSVRLHFFNCMVLGGQAQPLHAAALRWVKPAELNHYEFPAADMGLIRALTSMPNAS